MATRKSHHVVPSPGGGWDVKKGGAKRASIHRETKREAETGGRKISQNQGTELVIHGRDGVIQRSDSHGHDPNPPKDKE
jgi:hypothetical protein